MYYTAESYVKEFMDGIIARNPGENEFHQRDWDLNGTLTIDNGLVITPYFPLNNTLSGFGGTFNGGSHSGKEG